MAAYVETLGKHLSRPSVKQALTAVVVWGAVMAEAEALRFPGADRKVAA